MTHTLIPACHLIFCRSDTILLAQRTNTGYCDGFYSVPAGHIEPGETARQAMAREIAEEIGLAVTTEDLEIVHIMHRINSDPRQNFQERVDFFLSPTSDIGDPVNTEPEKCSEIGWYFLHNLPANTIDYIQQALIEIESGHAFSEYELTESRASQPFHSC